MEEFNLIKKTFFILSILALIAVSLSCVNAADMGNNATANLEDLAGEINSTDVGETLNLNQDYKSTNSSNQIIISKSITIDGNNHTIEAPDVKRVFLVNADNVCIKNLNFINSKALLGESSPGGEIMDLCPIAISKITLLHQLLEQFCGKVMTDALKAAIS